MLCVQVGDHPAALRILALVVGDMDAAEDYCGKHAGPDSYLTLLDMLLRPGNARPPLFVEACHLLAAQGGWVGVQLCPPARDVVLSIAWVISMAVLDMILRPADGCTPLTLRRHDIDKLTKQGLLSVDGCQLGLQRPLLRVLPWSALCAWALLGQASGLENLQLLKAYSFCAAHARLKMSQVTKVRHALLMRASSSVQRREEGGSQGGGPGGERRGPAIGSTFTDPVLL